MTSGSGPKKRVPTQSPSPAAQRIIPDADTDLETIKWLDEFIEKMANPGEKEEAYFARRRELGLGAGLDENGNLVRSLKSPID